MADPAVLGHAMGLPPKEALEHLLGKRLQVGASDWRAVWEDAHSRAFTVARMAQNDLLAETYAVVGRKLAQGIAGERAAKELLAAFRAKGWVGRQAVVNADGLVQTVGLGSPARARLIVRTNAATAYAAGRYRRQRENAEDRPIWRYDAVMDGATRQSHAELDGQAWRHDDPIWDAIYPPNGFGCRCSVQALTEDQAERRGDVALNPRSDPDAAQSEQRPAGELPIGGAKGLLRDRPRKRVRWTGADGKERTFAPDQGWGYNPGAHGPRIARIDDRNATPVRWMPTWRDYDLPDAEKLPRATPPEAVPKADSRQAAIRQIAKELGMGDAERIRIDTPFRPVELRRASVEHIAKNRKDARESWAKRIRPTLEVPNEVWLTLYAVSGGRGRRDRPEVRVHYVKAWNDGGTFSVTTEDHAGNVLITFFRADEWEDLDKRRRGILVYSADRSGG